MGGFKQAHLNAVKANLGNNMKTEIQSSSGNVYQDLGDHEADAMRIKAELPKELDRVPGVINSTSLFQTADQNKS